MSAQFITLEEAAKKLGVHTDELVEMRSRGDIFGYRDGASWKFKPEEIERVAAEMMGGAMDEDPAGSSILISEQDLGPTGSKLGSTIGSDINLGADPSDADSDVELVADPSSGSDVRLVAGKGSDEPRLAVSDDDDDELSLDSDEDDLLSSTSGVSGLGSDIKFGTSAESAIKLGSGTGAGSDIPLTGSDAFDLDLGPEGSDVLSGLSGKGSAIIKGDSDPSIDAMDLELSDDNDDLVLGGGSDLALGNDSGINLMSPADSGISLEDEPLDLAASGISGLDLASEGSDAASGVGSGLGSAVNFQQDEEFQLSASGSIEADEDSGSQVIELEDSSEFGDAAVALPAADGFDAFGSAEGDGIDMGGALGATAAAGAAVSMGAPEVPYSLVQVMCLLGILLLMCMSGIMVTDVVRNMWAWSDTSALTSGFTEAVLSAVGQNK
ncbi:MAG: helix-turn-helix domain-containing protein [Pirellulaceae bacterium]|nr:helix-turn-helix domain-containing protein [Pirellulaceae bacterium]